MKSEGKFINNAEHIYPFPESSIPYNSGDISRRKLFFFFESYKFRKGLCMYTLFSNFFGLLTYPYFLTSFYNSNISD